MTTVDQAPAVEAVSTRHDALLVGIELDKLNLPPAALWFPADAVRINVHLYPALTEAEARPPFEAWMDILGIEEFTESDGSNLKLLAEGTYRGVPVRVDTTVYAHRATTRTTTRKVTR